MTDRRMARRRAATIALLPAVAAVFGGSLSWAGSHDPLATGSAPAGTASPTPSDAGVSAGLAAQVLQAQQRLAALESALAQAKTAQDQAKTAQDQAAQSQSAAPAPAPAPAAPPPVHVTTRASG